MINWLTSYVGTAAYDKLMASSSSYPILDVRGLVDKGGNSTFTIHKTIQEGLLMLKTETKIIVCCDYGMSRSNSIAAGIISLKEEKPLSEIVNLYFNNVAEGGIKLDMFSSVFNALAKPEENATKNKTILITGASGFLGKSLQKKLSTKHKVIGLSSKDYNLLTNPISLDLFVKENNITTLIHLANPRVYTLNIALGETLVMLKNVLELCRINKIKFIYTSGWEVYSGYNTENIMADEGLPLYPRGSYGETKWLCEQLILQYSSLYNLEYNILRSSPVFGLNSDRPKFIYNFINKAKRNEPITTHKYLNGFPKIDLVHEDDVVEAIALLTEANGNNIFNIGGGGIANTNEIARFIIEKFKSHSAIQLNEIADYYPNVQMNYAKMNRVFGWTPKQLFKDFIIELAANK